MVTVFRQAVVEQLTMRSDVEINGNCVYKISSWTDSKHFNITLKGKTVTTTTVKVLSIVTSVILNNFNFTSINFTVITYDSRL